MIKSKILKAYCIFCFRQVRAPRPILLQHRNSWNVFSLIYLVQNMSMVWWSSVGLDNRNIVVMLKKQRAPSVVAAAQIIVYQNHRKCNSFLQIILICFDRYLTTEHGLQSRCPLFPEVEEWWARLWELSLRQKPYTGP